MLRAESQKEAAVKAMEKGYKPEHTNDCRPRTGDAELMDVKEFESFINE